MSIFAISFSNASAANNEKPTVASKYLRSFKLLGGFYHDIQANSFKT